jgi:hypothetical protein
LIRAPSFAAGQSTRAHRTSWPCLTNASTTGPGKVHPPAVSWLLGRDFKIRPGWGRPYTRAPSSGRRRGKRGCPRG